MRQLAITLILSASTHLQVAANENKQSDTSSLENISGEYAVCSAYYALIQAALVNAGDTDTAEKYRKQSEVAYQYASKYAKQGRTEEMARKETISKIQMHVRSMMVELRNDTTNVSTLRDRHSYKCKVAMEEPVEFGKMFHPETQMMD